ncbi:hypothetical protein SPHI_24900 [Sphingomonas jeddahensis]|uniref:Uncharacterized protein n=1 Tax=Sphingomonas jeddahensis TaxID=1915074 RepID=A0A1V2ESX6_9SPHN|nr:hypothetical protein SPHI_24900 [Sphingomonas jeddahensis]
MNETDGRFCAVGPAPRPHVGGQRQQPAGRARHAGWSRRRDRPLHDPLQPGDGPARRPARRRPDRRHLQRQRRRPLGRSTDLCVGVCHRIARRHDVRGEDSRRVEKRQRLRPRGHAQLHPRHRRADGARGAARHARGNRGGPGLPCRRQHARDAAVDRRQRLLRSRRPRREDRGRRAPRRHPRQAAGRTRQRSLGGAQLSRNRRPPHYHPGCRRRSPEIARQRHRAQMSPRAPARPRHGAGLGREHHRRGRQARRRRPAFRLHRAQAVHRPLRMRPSRPAGGMQPGRKGACSLQRAGTDERSGQGPHRNRRRQEHRAQVRG